MSATSPSVRIAVLLPSATQLLDLACIDLFAIMSKSYLSSIPFLPASISTLAPDVTFSYIGTMPSIPLTVQTSLQLTHTVTSPAASQPGNFDIVVVPGPDPNATFPEEVKAWLAAQGREAGTDVLCVCTGVFLCGEAGLLKGRRVCGPRGLQGEIKRRFGGEGLELVGDRLRWVNDGRFWSCGEFLA
jgi:transcriptional regulator GlxA family with amidase domain